MGRVVFGAYLLSWLGKFPGSDVISGIQFSVRPQRHDVRAVFFFMGAGTNYAQGMAPWILGFGSQGFVHQPLLDIGTGAAVELPVLEDKLG